MVQDGRQGVPMEAKRTKFVRDSQGELHAFRPLTVPELIDIETKLGGPLELRAKWLTFNDVVDIIALATGLNRADALAKFSNAADLRVAGLEILRAHGEQPERKRGSLDD